MTNKTPGDMYRELQRELRVFNLNELHLKLLRNAHVGWEYDEFGAPSIDPKRPYGNSDVLTDIAKLINPAIADYDDDERETYMRQCATALPQLHAETAIALQICLRRGEFKTGRYVRTYVGGPWGLT